MNQAQLKSTKAGNIVCLAVLILGMQGCASGQCDDYMTYDDILNTWVGVDLDRFERITDRRPLDSMERPGNKLQYTYNTPYYNYDGSQMYCRTWLDVDRNSGEIVSWRHEGDCYMHGRCTD